MKCSDIISVARPKTLAASSSPVILASALAYYDKVFNLIPALLCLGVALFAQIASNYANDYFDFKNGMDGDGRLGPERIVASGKTEAKPVLIGALIFLTLSCLCGLGLLFYAPWWIIPIGVVIALCVFGYSAGPFPLSHHALGDIAVLLFYGLVPVCFTYFVMTGHFSTDSLWYAIGIGLLSVNILIVNNYRDVVQDRATGKSTTIVLFGRKAGLAVYLLNVAAAAAIAIFVNYIPLKTWMIVVLLIEMIITWFELKKNDGPALNTVLGHTSRNVLLYAVLCSIALIMYA
ncbi:MAG: 1,4-dihydroxy-2-naphthoate octaprenyltransferase [Bacteroidales bacterium]|nr:1,4-dihydroxy-2-naphthoate octaprenyltransferase [Bacteroidales bacterium]MDD4670783.1 1,4-dihydroxy-2-naphthoate octaprenyltransferase [Bacteroidales bacterium]